MKRQHDWRSAVIFMAACALPILMIAVILAHGYEDGMTVFDLMGYFSKWMERPTLVGLKPHTPKFVLMAMLLYGFGIALFFSSRENRRPGEEYGSASWGDPRELCRKYMDRAHPDKNVILTKHVQLGLDGYKHRRNLNVLVIGGSGAGKNAAFLFARNYERQLFLFGH